MQEISDYRPEIGQDRRVGGGWAREQRAAAGSARGSGRRRRAAAGWRTADCQADKNMNMHFMACERD